MHESILKKLAFSAIFTGLILFCGTGQVTAQTVAAQPDFQFKVMATDHETGKAITANTKTIDVEVIFTNNTLNTYPNISLGINGYHIYNQNQNGVWMPAADTFPEYPGGQSVELPQNFPAFSSYTLGPLPGPTLLTLKNTSTKYGLVVSVSLNINYNTTWSESTDQSYNTTVTDVVYMPTTSFLPDFTITATPGGKGATAGSISPYGTVYVQGGADQTFTITPVHGYIIDSVLIDGVAESSPSSTYTFKNVTASHTIQATFGCNMENC